MSKPYSSNETRTIAVPAEAGNDHIEAEALAHPRVKSFLAGRAIRRVIQVPRKLVNIVLEG